MGGALLPGLPVAGIAAVGDVIIASAAQIGRVKACGQRQPQHVIRIKVEPQEAFGLRRCDQHHLRVDRLIRKDPDPPVRRS